MAPPELEPPTAVYDACVLYDSVQRDLLLQLHVEGAVRARWSRRILEEYLEHLTANRPDLGARVHHAPRAMAEAFPGSIIRSYEAFLGRVMLPDPKDDHVVAVALAARASVIVTANIRDFPAAVLAPPDIRTQKPDDFVVTLAGGDIAQVIQAVRTILGRLRRPPLSAEEYLVVLARHDLGQTASRIRDAGISI